MTRNYPTTATELEAKTLNPGAGRPTLLNRLLREQDEIRERLAQIDEAIAALEQNPGVARAVEAISRLGHI